MKYKTVWEYSDKTEAERLIHCAHQIAVGFYHVNNFIVLPYNPNINSANIVTFPDIQYNKIPRFWDKVKRENISTLPVKAPQDLKNQLEKLLIDASLPKLDFSKTQKTWKLAQKEVLEEIYKIIPPKKNKIKKIIIYPTAFGTSTSFNLINKKGQIILYLRQDQGVATIIEAILSSLTRTDVYDNLDGMWQESEIIVDWLITQSSLAKVIEKYDKTLFLPTMKGVRVKQQAKLLEESDNFYRKLGIPVNQKVFGLNGLTPEVNKKPLENLSPTEKIILRLLIQKAGGVVTFDEFGNELFKDENDFSLYAISKNIERIRNKLEANGISGSYIQTLRGKGYVLKN